MNQLNTNIMNTVCVVSPLSTYHYGVKLSTDCG